MSGPQIARTIPAVFSDADNTLWDTDAVYRRAHRWLFGEAAKAATVGHINDPVALVRSIDQTLAETHPAHLSYPPSLLVRELFRRLAPAKAPLSDDFTDQVAREFTRMTTELPALRQGVKSGLVQLGQLGYPVHVVSEASVERCMRLLRHHEIADYVESVESMRKDEQSFLILRRRMPTQAPAWMVGDQLTRDILPARSAGFHTLYFPGTFQPKWEQPVTFASDIIRVNTFAVVPTFIKNSHGDDQFSSLAALS